jgi:hypothetical protein
MLAKITWRGTEPTKGHEFKSAASVQQKWLKSANACVPAQKFTKPIFLGFHLLIV